MHQKVSSTGEEDHSGDLETEKKVATMQDTLHDIRVISYAIKEEMGDWAESVDYKECSLILQPKVVLFHNNRYCLYCVSTFIALL